MPLCSCSILCERQQKIQNKAARLVLRKELLKCSHLLPVRKKRVDVKIACLVFKTLNSLSPSYIQDRIEICKPTKALLSSASISLKIICIPPNLLAEGSYSMLLESGIIDPMTREVVRHSNLLQNV